MNNRGIALILTFTITIVLVILGTAVILRSVSERNLVQRHIESTQAFWLAEAGINHELRELKGNNWVPVNIGTVTLSPQGQYPIQQYKVEIKSPSKVWAHGMLTFQPGPRVVERIIELGMPFYNDVLYVAGDINVKGTSNSAVGDVTYGGTLSGTLNVTGELFNDPSISLDLLDFNQLRTISQSQGNYHDLQHLNGPFPASFWYDEANQIPNVVFLEGDLTLKGNDVVYGFFVVGGQAVCDTELAGTVSVNGGIYMQGDFTVKGGGGALNINGGVWVGGDANLNGGVTLNYNSEYMAGIQKLAKNSRVVWRDTQSPYALNP